MKKLLYILSIALFSYQCATEPLEDADNGTESYIPRTRSMERVNDSLFIVDSYNRRYLVDPDVITVKFKSDAKKYAHDVRELRTNRLGYIDIEVPKGTNVEEYVSQLEKTGEYVSVDYNGWGKYCYSPNDELTSQQWYLNIISAQSAWDITTGSSNVRVFVLDSGTDTNHSDLGIGSDGYSNIDTSLAWNYETNSRNVVTSTSHGTRVAGIIAAKTNNRRGMAGVAGGITGNQGVTVIPYCIGTYAPSVSIIDDAILDAVDAGARVIQLSFEVPVTPAITAAITYATQNGVLVVCASGNDTIPPITGNAVSYPASLNDVIAVGAIDRNGSRADFSNYGTSLNVVAPGIDILSTVLNGGYDGTGDDSSGTSFAAPQVSAIAALIWSKYPNFTRQQVINLIQETASLKYAGSPKDNHLGYGIVNAHRALLGHLSPQGDGGMLVNLNRTFTVPNSTHTQSIGVTFNGWTISTNNTYVVTGGTSGRSLTIKFTSLGQGTITANYTLPDGSTYSPSIPVRTQYLPSISYSGTVRPGSIVSFTGNTELSNVQWEWDVDYNGDIYSESGNHCMVQAGYSSNGMTVMCRVRNMQNGFYSDWASVYVPIQQYYSAPAPRDDEEANEKDHPTTPSQES